MDLVLSNFLKDYMLSESDLMSSFETSQYSDNKNLNKNTFKKANAGLNNVRSQNALSLLQTSDVTNFAKNKLQQINNDKIAQDILNKEAAFNKTKEIGGNVLQALPSAIDMISNLKGDKWDTSAQGGGVGSANGQAMASGAQGAMAGMQIAGPVGAVVGGILGAGTAFIGQRKAKKEYMDNRTKYNITENAIEKAKREEEYAYSKGLDMINSLKDLRQKQLGFLS